MSDEDGKGLNPNGRTVDLNGRKNVSGSLPQMRDPAPSEMLSVGSSTHQGRDSYVVGVSSDGPDRQPNTWDDITTMPEEVVK